MNQNHSNSDKSPPQQTSSGALRAGRQFSMLHIFMIVTLVAVVYGCLNWFGVFAHFVVWLVFLTAGPIVGLTVGMRWLRETDPIVSSVQAGALGATCGFLSALILLAPSYTAVSTDLLLKLVIFGTQGAFAIGGGLGFAVGAVRLVWQLLTRN